MDNTYVVGNYPPRRVLSPGVAAGLAEAHHQTGWSYRQVAFVLGTSHTHWWRLCHGERAPSRALSFVIIDTLDLEDDFARVLLDESVDDPIGR